MVERERTKYECSRCHAKFGVRCYICFGFFGRHHELILRPYAIKNTAFLSRLDYQLGKASGPQNPRGPKSSRFTECQLVVQNLKICLGIVNIKVKI